MTVLIKNQVIAVQASKVPTFHLFLLLSLILVESSIPRRQMRSKGQKGKGHFSQKIILSNVYYNFKCYMVCLKQASLQVTPQYLDTALSISNKKTSIPSHQQKKEENAFPSSSKRLKVYHPPTGGRQVSVVEQKKLRVRKSKVQILLYLLSVV